MSAIPQEPGLSRRDLIKRSTAVGALALTGSAALSGTAAAATPRSSAARRAAAQASAVISGDARFEVLSPTLIRTEYAGDAHFTDAATFNAIGRDNFAAAHLDRKSVV